MRERMAEQRRRKEGKKRSKIKRYFGAVFSESVSDIIPLRLMSQPQLCSVETGHSIEYKAQWRVSPLARVVMTPEPALKIRKQRLRPSELSDRWDSLDVASGRATLPFVCHPRLPSLFFWVQNASPGPDPRCPRRLPKAPMIIVQS